jgi:hypothetical protein
MLRHATKAYENIRDRPSIRYAPDRFSLLNTHFSLRSISLQKVCVKKEGKPIKAFKHILLEKTNCDSLFESLVFSGVYARIKGEVSKDRKDTKITNVCYLPAGPLGITPSLSSVIETETENEGVSLTKAQPRRR